MTGKRIKTCFAAILKITIEPNNVLRSASVPQSESNTNESASLFGKDLRENDSRSLIQRLLPYTGLMLCCFLMGLYCCELNRQLYQHQSPAYDSLSYNEKLFRVMTISQNQGLDESISDACFSGNTNCLPFVIAAVVAPVVQPSRMVGIWIQAGLLFLFLASLFNYLTNIRELSSSSALAGCLVYLAANCVFLEDGGLSDFRMDFALFLGLALTSTWYLSSMERPSDWKFICLGASAAVCCLFRATAPVYLLFSLGPLIAANLLVAPNRAIKLRGIAIAATVTVILAGWFFIFNFEYLKYYYFDWNTDANAKLPLSRALRHFKRAHQSVGEPALLLLICWWFAVLIRILPKQSLIKWLVDSIRDRDIDFRIGWLAIAAVVMMVARRAGLNPFVCMPAVFGMVLFFTLPCLRQIDKLSDSGLTRWCWAVLLICIGIAGARGWHRHAPNDFNNMSANHRVIDMMISDAQLNNKKELSYGTVQITDFDSNVLYSVLLFDRKNSQPHLNGVVVDGVDVQRLQTFSKPAQFDWAQLDGETDEAKIAGMIREANAKIDYLIVPDEASAKSIPLKVTNVEINKHLTRIRELITNNQSWAMIKSRIQIDENEFVEIYRNMDRN